MRAVADGKPCNRRLRQGGIVSSLRAVATLTVVAAVFGGGVCRQALRRRVNVTRSTANAIQRAVDAGEFKAK